MGKTWATFCAASRACHSLSRARRPFKSTTLRALLFSSTPIPCPYPPTASCSRARITAQAPAFSVTP